jgi:hypothetical protein
MDYNCTTVQKKFPADYYDSQRDRERKRTWTECRKWRPRERPAKNPHFYQKIKESFSFLPSLENGKNLVK